MGLLRVGAWLRAEGKETRLLQCERFHNVDKSPVPEAAQRGRSVWRLADYTKGRSSPKPFVMPVFYNGLPPTRILEEIRLFQPDELWLNSGLTFHAQGSHIIAEIARRHLDIPVRIGA